MINVKATPLLVETRAWIDSNRVMLAATRYRIARCRRKLAPTFAITGGAAPPLRETVRALLISGMLPPISGRVIAGYGTGKHCVICHEPVTFEEVEYELDCAAEGAVVCHLSCFTVWRDETARARGESAADGYSVDRETPA